MRPLSFLGLAASLAALGGAQPASISSVTPNPLADYEKQDWMPADYPPRRQSQAQLDPLSQRRKNKSRAARKRANQSRRRNRH